MSGINVLSLILYLTIPWTYVSAEANQIPYVLTANIVGDVAEMFRVSSTSECGKFGREEYCTLTGIGKEESKGQECNVCYRNSHPIKSILSSEKTFWKSENSVRLVTIDFSLGQPLYIAYITVTMGISPRPKVWILERSVDFGRSYQPWQYFAPAEQCLRIFNVSHSLVPSNMSDVICTSEYSKIIPLHDGEIHMRMLSDRFPDNQLNANNTKLKEWINATNIRFRFLDYNTLLGELNPIYPNDLSVTRRHFYSIRHVQIGPMCECPGNGNRQCYKDPNSNKFECACENNTCGMNCDQCCPPFNQYPYNPELEEPCEACECYGHATSCVYNQTVADLNWSINIAGEYSGGGVCDCKHNTAGINCERCKPGFYPVKGVEWRDPNICQPCACNVNGSASLTCDQLGNCQCKEGVTDRMCDRCEEHHWGPVGACQPCRCNLTGSVGEACDPVTGACPCLPGFTGRTCDNCSRDQIYIQGQGCKNITEVCDSCTTTLVNEVKYMTVALDPALSDALSWQWPYLVRARLRYSEVFLEKESQSLNRIQKKDCSGKFHRSDKMLGHLKENLEILMTRFDELKDGKNFKRIHPRSVLTDAKQISNVMTNLQRKTKELLAILDALSAEAEWEPVSQYKLEKYEGDSEILIRKVRSLDSNGERLKTLIHFQKSKQLLEHVYSLFVKPVETIKNLTKREKIIRSKLLELKHLSQPRNELFELIKTDKARLTKIKDVLERFYAVSKRNLDSRRDVNEGFRIVKSQANLKSNSDLKTTVLRSVNKLRDTVNSDELNELPPLVTKAERAATELDTVYSFLDMKLETMVRNRTRAYEKLTTIPKILTGIKEPFKRIIPIMIQIAELQNYAQRELSARTKEIIRRIEELQQIGEEEGSGSWENEDDDDDDDVEVEGLSSGSSWMPIRDQPHDESNLPVADWTETSETAATKPADWITNPVQATLGTATGNPYSGWTSTLKSIVDWLNIGDSQAGDEEYMDDIYIDEGNSDVADVSLKLKNQDLSKNSSPRNDQLNISIVTTETTTLTYEASETSTISKDYLLASFPMATVKPTSAIPHNSSESNSKEDFCTKSFSLSLLYDSLLIQYKINRTLLRFNNVTTGLDRTDTIVQTATGDLKRLTGQMSSFEDKMSWDEPNPTINDIMEKCWAIKLKTNLTLTKLLKQHDHVGPNIYRHKREITEIKKQVENAVGQIASVSTSLKEMEERWNNRVGNNTKERVQRLKQMIERARKMAVKIQSPLCLESPGFIQLEDPETHPSPVTKIHISIKPADFNGIVYSIGNVTKLNLLQLVLTNGTLLLMSLYKDQSTVLKSSHVVPPNKWLHVTTSIIGGYLHLSLYNSSGLVEDISALNFTARSFLTKLVPPFYIGGFPDEIKTIWLPDFEGCVDNLIIGDKPMGLLGPVMSRGIQIVKDEREPDPSHCVMMTESGRMSLDLKGSANKLQKELKMNPLDVKFSFKTIQKSALLLHLRDTMNVSNMFVTIEGGAVVVHMVIKKEHKKASSRRIVYNDGEWHHVQVKRSITTIKFTVDQKDQAVLNTLFWKNDEMVGSVTLGGEHSFRPLPRFLGYLSNVTINGQNWLTSEYKRSGGTIFNGCTQSLGDCVKSTGESLPLTIDSISSNIDTISFQFNTSQQNGTIAHFVSGQTRIHLYCLGDHVQLWARDFKMSVRKSDDLKVGDNMWHTVVIILGSHSSSVTIDKVSWKVDVSSHSTYTSSILYLGGTSPGHTNYLPGGSVLPTVMAAEFRYLVLNERLQDLTSQVIPRKLTACG